MQSVTVLSVVMLSVFTPNVVILNAVPPNVVAPFLSHRQFQHSTGGVAFNLQTKRKIKNLQKLFRTGFETGFFQSIL